MKFSIFNKISTSAIRCVSLLLTILVLGVGEVWGNTAKIDGDDWTGNRSWHSDSHVTFTFCDPGNYGNRKYDKYLQIEGDDNEFYSIKWSVQSGCTINVTGLECKVGRAWPGDGSILINGTDIGKLKGWNTNTVSINTLSLGNNDSIIFRATRDANIYWIEITYTITANNPTPTNTSIDVTVNESAKQLVDISTLFSLPVDAPADFALGDFGLISSYDHGWIIGETTNFWADAAGEYWAKARVLAGDDHNASEYSYAKITVNRLANTLAVAGTEYTKYVDDTIPDIVSNVNSDAAITTSSDFPLIAYYDVEKDTIFIPNSGNASFIEKTFEIHISQAQTSQYEGVNKSISLTVKKYDNILSATSASSTMPLFSTLDGGVLLSATNTDYVSSPISCDEQTKGIDTLTYTYTPGTRTVAIASHQFLGTGTWRFTQPESRKYKAGEGTFSIDVVNETCRFYGSYSKSWDLATNWESSKKPTDDYASVIIDGELELTGTEEKKAYSISITSRPDASITISPKAGLTVGAGGISGTNGHNLILQADSIPESGTVGQTGFLRVSPYSTAPMPQATIELYSIAYTDSRTFAAWQYVGKPIADNIKGWDFCEYGEQFVYGWDEESSNWYDCFEQTLEPFKGYCLTQNNEKTGKKFTFEGTLCASTAQEVTLSYHSGAPEAGYHVVANSFTAPIDISKLTSEDFGGAEATIYMFNTGTQEDVKDHDITTESSSEAGQYIAVTPGTAAKLRKGDSKFPVVIPPMQGFMIQTTKNATMTLDYAKLVWGADELHTNEPMRVANRWETDETNVMKVTISDGKAADNLYLLSSDEYVKTYENGYDARKKMSDDEDLPNVFAVEGDDQLAIDATSEMNGTFIGVRTGAESAYTLAFTNLDNIQDLVLHDAELDQDVEIIEGAKYTFFAAPNSLITDRFTIIESGSGNTPGVTTDCENVNSGAKVQKFIQNGQMFVLKNGVLYNAQGLRVR